MSNQILQHRDPIAGSLTDDRQRTVWDELRRKAPLYLFLIPTIAFLAVFMYYPAFTAVRLSFYHWDGFSPPPLDWVGQL